MDRAAQALKRLKGPIATVNVCFNEDGTVNYTAVGKYINWLCEQKIPVLLLTYGSSEFASLSDEEIWELTETVARANGGRSLCIASTDFWKPAKTREFLKHADSVGVDAVKVQINPWLPKTRKVLVRYFDLIERASDMPLLLWGHAPPPFPVEVVAELAQRRNIIGMKNDADPFYDYYDLIRSTADEGFAVISGGQMRNFAFGYQIGSPAYLCTIAPFRPDIALVFYDLLVARRFDEAWQMVFQYEEPWLKKALEMDWLLSIKSALLLYGLYPNNRPCETRRPHTVEESEKIRQCLESVFGPIQKVSL